MGFITPILFSDMNDIRKEITKQKEEMEIKKILWDSGPYRPGY
jgi:hypothetical protein